MQIWKVLGLNCNLDKLWGKIAILSNLDMISHMPRYKTLIFPKGHNLGPALFTEKPKTEPKKPEPMQIKTELE